MGLGDIQLLTVRAGARAIIHFAKACAMFRKWPADSVPPKARFVIMPATYRFWLSS
jgi:hypothetical protein